MADFHGQLYQIGGNGDCLGVLSGLGGPHGVRNDGVNQVAVNTAQVFLPEVMIVS